MKKCIDCGLEKDFNEFCKCAKSKDGLFVYCRKCLSIRGKKYRNKDKEKYNSRCREYRIKNKDKCKKYWKKNYEKYKEIKKEYQKIYYLKNRENILKKESIKNKTDERKKQVKEYRKKNKQKINTQREAHTLVRYAVKLGILKKSEYCELCKIKCVADGHHKDYTKPLEVIWLCRKCHRNI